MYIVTNKLTQKQTKIWQTSTNSSSINIKIITTLQIYNIMNKHVKLDKFNKDSLVTVHFLSIMTQKVYSNKSNAFRVVIILFRNGI